MRASSLQTPRTANRVRSKETHLSKRSDPNSGNGKSQKIVPKRLSWDFAAAPEEIHPVTPNPADSSPETTSKVEDPEEMISPLFVSSETDELGQVEPGEITGRCTDSDAVKNEEKETEEKVKALVVIDRVREALLEIIASDVSDGTKRSVEALVEIMIGDPAVGSRARFGFSDLVFWASVRIGILFFLIWLVTLMYALVATAIWLGRRRDEAFAGLPPT